MSSILIVSHEDDAVTISRSEFCNLDTHKPPLCDYSYDDLLALPYHLYAQLARLKDKLGCSVQIQPLWGWGYRCDVHRHYAKKDFTLDTEFESVHEYVHDEIDPFIHAIKNWMLKENNRLTYTIK